MNQIENILAAVGQFPQDDVVLVRAAEIARTHGARITIVHVIDDVVGIDLAPGDMRLIQHQARLIAQDNIEAAIARVEIDAAKIDIRIENGSPYLCLIELIKEINTNLVVMRAHEDDSILGKIIGSTTDRVIRTSSSPVLVVKRPVTQAYKRVVVAIEMSDDSASSVPFVALMVPLAGLNLVHVVQIPPQFETAMLRSGSSQADIAAHRYALMRKAKIYLRDVSKTLAHRSVKSATRVIVGDSATSLVRATWSPQVDLIVLGPGRAGKIKKGLLGSITRRVLRSATCDVLIFQ